MLLAATRTLQAAMNLNPVSESGAALDQQRALNIRRIQALSKAIDLQSSAAAVESLFKPPSKPRKASPVPTLPLAVCTLTDCISQIAIVQRSQQQHRL